MSTSLITVAEADARLTAFQGLYPVEEVTLEAATGRILREAVRADREYPALNRSRMDGLAIAFAAWEMGIRAFPVCGMAKAGDPRQELSDASGCVEIMTGAPVPLGADTVIPYEVVRIEGGLATVVSEARVQQGQFIHTQGSDCARGEILVEAGERLSAVRIAAAASMGYGTLQVTRRPRVSILTTGDELVGVEDTPAAHQVRASNGHALRALLESFRDSVESVRLETVGDAREDLKYRLSELLASSDVVLITGGVSAGKFDEVPGVLKELGIEEVFHKIAQKPGKPLWFGTTGFGAGRTGQLVFGLPGNPVSALVCARRYVIPLLQIKSHAKSGTIAGPALHSAPHSVPRVYFSGSALTESSRLTRFIPVGLEADSAEGILRATASTVNGSGDFSGLGRSDGFVEIPALPSEPSKPKGELMAFFGWES